MGSLTEAMWWQEYVHPFFDLWPYE
jgi:hypothetical protein